jgi:hypothetical protein
VKKLFLCGRKIFRPYFFFIACCLLPTGSFAQDMTARDEGAIVGHFRELDCIGSWFSCAVSGGKLSLTVTTQDGAADGSTNSSTTFTYIQHRALVVNSSNAGNITMQWAQVASSGTITVHAGSYMIARRWQ